MWTVLNEANALMPKEADDAKKATESQEKASLIMNYVRVWSKG